MSFPHLVKLRKNSTLKSNPTPMTHTKFKASLRLITIIVLVVIAATVIVEIIKWTA